MDRSMVISLRERVMARTCFQHGPHPRGEDTSRTHRLFKFQNGRGLGGHVPRAGAGSSPLAKQAATPTTPKLASLNLAR
jgi:hypothetical protein